MKNLIGIIVVLAGCGAVPPAPPQIVKVPVYEPCITGAPIVKPNFEFGKLGLEAPDGDKVLALARDWPRGRKYEELLEAAVEGCKQ